MKEAKLSLSQQLESCGYVHLGVIDHNTDTQAIAESIGRIVNIPTIPIVQRLIPRHMQASPGNIYSGNFGLAKFPLHTDLAHWYIPPRYLVLRCIVPASKVHTLVLHQEYFLEGLLTSTLKRAIFQPRRKLEDKLFFLRLLQDNIFRWDQIFLLPKNKEAEEVSEHIRNKSEDDRVTKICFNEAGESLIIDNWKVLHGRSSVPNSGMLRVIERVYLSEVFM